MKFIGTVAAFILALSLLPSQAEARHRYHRIITDRIQTTVALGCVPDNNGHQSCLGGPNLTSSLPSRSEGHETLGGGVVKSHKTGAIAHVAAQYAALFQAYIDDLESAGAAIRFMGGIRRGHCWSGGMHPCGKALDVCQYSRDVVDSRCHLPSRSTLAAIAERHGLFEGGQWCHGDMGHAQVGVSAAACGTTLMARSRHNRIKYARR